MNESLPPPPATPEERARDDENWSNDDHALGFHVNDPQDDCPRCVFTMKAGERSRNRSQS